MLVVIYRFHEIYSSQSYKPLFQQKIADDAWKSCYFMNSTSIEKRLFVAYYHVQKEQIPCPKREHRTSCQTNQKGIQSL